MSRGVKKLLVETAGYVFTDILFLENHSPYFFKKWLKINKALEIISKYGRTEAKVGPRAAERIIFGALQLILALYFKMLPVALSGLVLICIFLRRHIFAILMPTR